MRGTLEILLSLKSHIEKHIPVRAVEVGSRDPSSNAMPICYLSPMGGTVLREGNMPIDDVVSVRIRILSVRNNNGARLILESKDLFLECFAGFEPNYAHAMDESYDLTERDDWWELTFTVQLHR